jgi:translocation and assembly module TamB
MTNSVPAAATPTANTTPPPAPQQRTGWQRAVRWLFAGLLLLLLALLLAGAATWVWMGRDSSLPTVLNLAKRWLPPGHSLEVRQAQGSLRQGGHIAWLRWQSPSLAVEVENMQLRWQWAALWQRQLHIEQWHIARLQITATPEPDPPPLQPLEQLLLPLSSIHLPFQVQQLVWSKGSTSVEATALAGHYGYDGQLHQLQIDHFTLAQGRYSAQARLQAQAPMQLHAQVNGQVQTSVPQVAEPLLVAAQAKLEGTLAGAAARLVLQAQLRPSETTAAPLAAMRADVSAHIAPWASQPLEQAQAQLQGLDLAALWPQAPRTALAGQIHLTPQTAGWVLQAELNNTLAGPWDKQRLPLSKLQAQAHYDGQQWQLPQAQWQVGSGHIDLQGSYAPATRTLQGSAELHNLHPAALHSRLDAAPLNGRLQAHSPDGVAVDFTVDVRAAASQKRHTLPIEQIQAQGQWQAPVLHLPRLQVQALQAQLQANGLKLRFAEGLPQVDGTITLDVPGAQLRANGHWKTAQESQGQLQAHIRAAERVQTWLQSLPGGAAAALSGQTLQGQAQLTLDWSALQARLRLDAQARINGHAANLHTQLQATQQGGSAWQAQLAAFKLQLQTPAHSTPWKLELGPLQGLWQPATAGASSLELSAGSAHITSPLPGAVALQWQPAQLRWGGAQGPEWQSRGRLQGLPLAWVDALAPAQSPLLAKAGLSSQLLLQGDWDIQTHPKLRAQLQLQRAQGDLQLLHDEQQPATPAGLRQLLLQLQVEQEQLRAKFVWDSAQAGQIQAQAQSRLQRQGNGWMWPENAPLAAQIKAQLPDMGVWSMLAPPGWRIRGTLDADATLSGSRQAPQWQGRIDAKQLALRSLVDGIDLHDGQLRTVLHSNRLEIKEWSWRGGQGSQARIAGYSGNLTPAPRDGGYLQGSGNIYWNQGGTDTGIRLQLEAQAHALQVLVRADRQASVSGKLQALLEQGQLTLRGQLQVNRAAILLPDASAPRLGEDVVVVRSASRLAAAKAKATSATAPAAPPSPAVQTRKPIDLAIELDLGRDFALQGHGITTRLRGQLAVRSAPVAGAPLRVTGEIRTEQGRYRAWGQLLDIETGLLRFNGTHDNPALDMLAIRPNISVRAGVQVSGTAQQPLVRLYADPDLPDAEKLAWVVTGRSSAAGGAEAALLQQAALALLGQKGGDSGNLAQKLGLDEIGFKAPEGGNGASTAAITLGKRLSSKLYLTYEHGLSGAVGVISIFYDLSRHLSLRGQTGSQSAIDIIYTVRHD